MAARVSDSARPWRPASPCPRPSTRTEASDTPAGARPQLPDRAGSRPRPPRRRADWRRLSPLPAGERDGEWRLLRGGGIAHARNTPAPHAGTARPGRLPAPPLRMTSRGSASSRGPSVFCWPGPFLTRSGNGLELATRLKAGSYLEVVR